MNDANNTPAPFPAPAENDYYALQRRKKLKTLFIVVVLIAGVIAAYLFLSGRQPAPEVSDIDASAPPSPTFSSLPHSPEEKGYVSQEQGYVVPVPNEWQLFEEETYPERATLSAAEIRNLVGTCGFSCSAQSIVKLGNFSATACTTNECRSMNTTEGASLTIYVFGNPAQLSIDEFLEQALFKAVDSESIFKTTREDGSQARMERNFLEDGTEIRSYYFIKGDKIYLLDQNVFVTNPDDYEAVFTSLRRAAALFELQ